MTAVLQNLRQLEAARRRGELTNLEYTARRAAMMAAVEEATLAEGEEAAAAKSAPRGNPWAVGLMLLAAAFVLTALGTWALGDLSLALTLAVTLLAAVTVTAFQSLGE
ncbi:MAG: hypothetical protein AAFY38_14065 [Pseudomonadota bacterium]